MARPSIVEAHPERGLIELKIARKVPYSIIAKKHRVSLSAIKRHRQKMDPKLLASLSLGTGPMSDLEIDRLRRSESEGLVHQLVLQRQRLATAYDMAIAVDDYRAMGQIEARVTKNLEVSARVLGEIQSASKHVHLNLTANPEYARLRAGLLRALKPYPDAAKAVGLELMASDHLRHLVLTCRQSGKSTTCGAMAVEQAKTDPGSLTLIVSPSLRQSSLMIQKIMSFHSKLRNPSPIELESGSRLVFKNGSAIIGLPGSEATIRGYSGPALIILDEAARVADETYAAIRPMLATSQGRLIALTTPAGCRGWFHKAWHEGSNWKRTRITADECPRISQEFLAEELRELGPTLFDQEYRCIFQDDSDQFFSSAILDRIFSKEVKPLWA